MLINDGSFSVVENSACNDCISCRSRGEGGNGANFTECSDDLRSGRRRAFKRGGVGLLGTVGEKSGACSPSWFDRQNKLKNAVRTLCKM